MILKIEHGYVHLDNKKVGGIYRIEDFDDDELREQKYILSGNLEYTKFSESQRDEICNSITAINTELKERLKKTHEQYIGSCS